MKHSLPPLEALKVFESAARQLSFTLAARELCITKSAVSYQIRRLEEHIGCPLFTRAVRQIVLTDAGRELYKTTQWIFTELGRTLVQIRPDASDHDVLVGASTHVAARWLSPRVAGFVERHPQVSIVLQHAVNSSEFRLDAVDIAIRWDRCDGRAEPQRLREMPAPLFVACSPQFALRLGANPQPSAIIGLPLLGDDHPQDLWQEWAAVAGIRLDNPRRRIDDANVRAQAAIDGQGLVLADQMMRNELRSGALVAPFDIELRGYGYVIMRSPQRRHNAEAAALCDWLCGATE